jgi:antirestriction protein ArdC
MRFWFEGSEPPRAHAPFVTAGADFRIGCDRAFYSSARSGGQSG